MAQKSLRYGAYSLRPWRMSYALSEPALKIRTDRGRNLPPAPPPRQLGSRRQGPAASRRSIASTGRPAISSDPNQGHFWSMSTSAPAMETGVCGLCFSSERAEAAPLQVADDQRRRFAARSSSDNPREIPAGNGSGIGLHPMLRTTNCRAGGTPEDPGNRPVSVPIAKPRMGGGRLPACRRR